MNKHLYLWIAVTIYETRSIVYILRLVFNNSLAFLYLVVCPCVFDFLQHVRTQNNIIAYISTIKALNVHDCGQYYWRFLCSFNKPSVTLPPSFTTSPWLKMALRSVRLPVPWCSEGFDTNIANQSMVSPSLWSFFYPCGYLRTHSIRCQTSSEWRWL